MSQHRSSLCYIRLKLHCMLSGCVFYLYQMRMRWTMTRRWQHLSLCCRQRWAVVSWNAQTAVRCSQESGCLKLTRKRNMVSFFLNCELLNVSPYLKVIIMRPPESGINTLVPCSALEIQRGLLIPLFWYYWRHNCVTTWEDISIRLRRELSP